MFLTEKSLVEFVVDLYHEDEYATNKKIRDIDYSCRPDYVNYTKKLIVEFDGFRHYNDAKTILKDQEKDKIFSDSGYKVVRWPYFIQLSTSSVLHYLGIELSIEMKYPHGFIDSRALLPADFNSLGLERFKRELEELPRDIYLDIKLSLDELILKNDKRLVWPIKREGP